MSTLPRAERGSIRVKSYTFSHSVLGAPLEVFSPAWNQTGRPLIIAGQHGEEPETTSFLSTVLRSLPPESLQVDVILCLNPDGLVRGTRGNANGVDLNRNFPTDDWSAAPVRTAWEHNGPHEVAYSPGESPGSEPETQALLSLLEQRKPSWVVSLHAPLACVDDPQETRVGEWLSQQMALSRVSDIGYKTPGSFGSWAGENRQPLVTVELPMCSRAELAARYTSCFRELLTCSSFV